MKKQINKIDVFDETLLCSSLNAFEGNSRHFMPLNAHFAAFLTAYFKNYDLDASSILLEIIKKDKGYKVHPFYPPLLKFLTSGRITKREVSKISAGLLAYPTYPLATYLNHIIAPISTKKTNDSFLLFINYLKNPVKNIPTLSRLSNEGFAFATFNNIAERLAADDYSDLERLLLLAVEQNDEITDEIATIYLEKLLYSYEFSAKVNEEIYRLLVKNGAISYLLPLVGLYEKDANFTLAFFHLHLGHSLNIKEASSRLLSYYKNPKNLPSNEEVIKYLENYLN